MANCILHVGMHKTGTTSIQKSLQDLDDDRFYYARVLTSPNHSVSVFSIFAEKPDSIHLRSIRVRKNMTVDQITAEAKSDLKASITAAGERTLVISGEGLIRLTEHELKKLREFLVRHGCSELEIRAYIRPPGSYLSSAVQQRIKAGYFKEFQIERSLPNYRGKFEKFDQVFGAENVKLAKFDRTLLKNGDVVEDFCERSGIAMSSVSVQRMNDSVPRLAALLIYQYNQNCGAEQLPPLKARHSLRLAELLQDIDKTAFKLAPDVVARAIGQVKSDIEWMEQRLGQKLDEQPMNGNDLDISSEADLQRPIEDINLKLRAILEDGGIVVEAAHSDNTWQLIANLVWPLKAQLRRAKLDANDAGGHAGRKPRQGDRQWNRPAEGIDEDDRAAARRLRRINRNRETGSGVASQHKAKFRGADFRNAGLRGAGLERGCGQSRGREAGIMQGVAQYFGQRPEPGMGTGIGVWQGAGPGQTSGMGNSAGRGKGQGQGAGKGKGRNPIHNGPQAASMLTPAQIDPHKLRDILAALAPRPMVNAPKNLLVYWSPKSACTTAYVWFSHISGFLPEMRRYGLWPHRHRQDVYERSQFYSDSVRADLSGANAIRIMRDPYSRAVSIYRHAVQSRFADRFLANFRGGSFNFEQGMSFQDFLDFVATLDMSRVDIHFRPQFHLYEREKPPSHVINVSKTDLFEGLNAFERDVGLPPTDFAAFGWLHDLEKMRKAKQEPMEGSRLDTTAFSRQQVKKLGQFPNYGQLLTPEARQKIELIYKSDFDAYREFL